MVQFIIIIIVFHWVILGEQDPLAEPQQQPLMQPVQAETWQDLNSELILSLPKGSRHGPHRTYQTCFMTREYATMIPHMHSANDDDSIFASAVQENSKFVYTKSLLVHGRLPETILQYSSAAAECMLPYMM